MQTVKCPHCKKQSRTRLTSDETVICRYCGYEFYPTESLPLDPRPAMVAKITVYLRDADGGDYRALLAQINLHECVHHTEYSS